MLSVLLGYCPLRVKGLERTYGRWHYLALHTETDAHYDLYILG